MIIVTAITTIHHRDPYYNAVEALLSRPFRYRGRANNLTFIAPSRLDRSPPRSDEVEDEVEDGVEDEVDDEIRMRSG